MSVTKKGVYIPDMTVREYVTIDQWCEFRLLARGFSMDLDVRAVQNKNHFNSRKDPNHTMLPQKCSG